MRKLKLLSIWLLVIFILFAPFYSCSAAWTEVAPTGTAEDILWRVIASDSDGSVLLAGVDSGRLYLSTNSGTSWAVTGPAGLKIWQSVASDSDGSVLLAGTEGSRLYLSTDSGANWAETQPAGDNNKNWYAVASDADGSVLIAGDYAGLLYVSTNGGSSWTEAVTPLGVGVAANWRSVASDSDGTNLMAAAYGGRVYISTDSGANWAETQPAGDNNKNWRSVASDADGSNLIAAVTGGRMYVSTNGGTNWAETGTGAFIGVDKTWQSVASDSDGSNLIAAAGSGRVYISTDSGANWTDSLAAGDNDKNWYAVASDAVGTNLISGVYGGRVYITDLINPTVSTLSPADGATTVTATDNLVITFSEAVDAESGNITIKKTADDSTFETIDVAGASVTGTGTTTITINPAGTFASSTGYYVQIAATAFDDAAGNSYAGISDTTTWNFTTADFTNPTVSTLSPADGATTVTATDNLVITFSEAVDAESGNITIKKTADDSTFETIDVAGASVTGTGTTQITINPSSSFAEGTGYYVQIDATAFDDASSNSYAGISDTTTWNFTVGSCATVTNAATYNAYPTCGAATCNSSYTLTGGQCVSQGGGGLPAVAYLAPAIPATGSFSIIINNSAATTSNRIVNLKFNAGLDVKKMAISMTGDFTDAGQEEYKAEKQWDLCSKMSGLILEASCPDKTYTVYVKFYTSWGQSSTPVSASIALKSGTAPILEQTPILARETALAPALNFSFSRNIERGMAGNDVAELQKYLNNAGFKVAEQGPGSPGNETTFFGSLTKNALIKFQEANGIKPAWGYFGPITRRFIKK